MTTEVESESKYLAECEVCGREVCECPRPLGECCECGTLLYAGEVWVMDSDGGHWCVKCWPGGEA